MTETAITVMEEVAAELRTMPIEDLLSAQNRVHSSQRLAGRLESAARAAREAMEPETRPVTPRTLRPCERRRMLRIGGRAVQVETRRA